MFFGTTLAYHCDAIAVAETCKRLWQGKHTETTDDGNSPKGGQL